MSPCKSDILEESVFKNSSVIVSPDSTFLVGKCRIRVICRPESIRVHSGDYDLLSRDEDERVLGVKWVTVSDDYFVVDFTRKVNRFAEDRGRRYM